MKVVGDLREAGGGLLLAVLVEQKELNIPFLHRKLRHGRILRTSERVSSQYSFARTPERVRDVHVMLLGIDLELPLQYRIRVSIRVRTASLIAPSTAGDSSNSTRQHLLQSASWMRSPGSKG